jgi:hypothetical protein
MHQLCQTAGINFFKLWRKANGKKRKVTSKLQLCKHSNQRNFCMKMSLEIAFFKAAFCHLRKKAAHINTLMKLTPGRVSCWFWPLANIEPVR